MFSGNKKGTLERKELIDFHSIFSGSSSCDKKLVDPGCLSVEILYGDSATNYLNYESFSTYAKLSKKTYVFISGSKNY